MRQDQYERLQVLEEKLVDVYLGEIDTEQWPGHGIALQAMDRDTRGDRYWSKRNAAATAVLIARTQTLIGSTQGPGTTQPAPEGEENAEADLDKEIAGAEAQAERMRTDLIKRLQKAGRGK